MASFEFFATSMASAVKTPPYVALRYEMLALTSRATVPWELNVTAKARSARAKMAPPWTRLTPFRCSYLIFKRALALPSDTSINSMPRYLANWSFLKNFLICFISPRIFMLFCLFLYILIFCQEIYWKFASCNFFCNQKIPALISPLHKQISCPLC